VKPEELRVKLRGPDAPAAQAAAIAAHLPALLALADAVRLRRDARCWSLGEHESSRLCLCGSRESAAECPVALADRAVLEAYERLEAVK
jgi:hypothetical protein